MKSETQTTVPEFKAGMYQRVCPRCLHRNVCLASDSCKKRCKECKRMQCKARIIPNINSNGFCTTFQNQWKTMHHYKTWAGKRFA